MNRKEILRRLEERLARGEISEKTYLEIKGRYDAEPGEAELPEAHPAGPGALREAVARVTQEAARVAEEAVGAVGETFRAVDFSEIGVRLSGEAIKLAGSNVISGNPVRTREFKAAGAAKVNGDLEAEVAKVAGSCAFSGNVRVGDFRSSGSCEVAGALKAETVEASGSLRVGGDVEVEEFVAIGSFKAGGRVQAEAFRSSGSVSVGGGLKAEEVLIEIGGNSTIPTIEAAEIRVQATGGFLRPRGQLNSERIEGTEVYLEATRANHVKGQEVRIGPHCQIGVVEARELVVHESSEVRERRAPGTE